LEALPRIGDAARVFKEIRWIWPTGVKVILYTWIGSRASNDEIAGTLDNQDVELCGQSVDFGRPCRHVTNPAVAIRIDRMVEYPRLSRPLMKLLDSQTYGQRRE